MPSRAALYRNAVRTAPVGVSFVDRDHSEGLRGSPNPGAGAPEVIADLSTRADRP